MPVLKRLLAQTAIGAMVMVSLSGCDRSTREIAVDHHTFRVPEKHLVKGSIPWLPASQHEGLSFVMNPEASPQEQKIVGLGSTQTTCNPQNPPTSNMLSSACAGAEKSSSKELGGDFRPEKVHPQDDPTQWAYRVRDAAGNYRTVATCFALSDGKSGLCRSINSYKDLVYSVGLRDSEIQHLPEIWAKVREMLASWEVGSGNNG